MIGRFRTSRLPFQPIILQDPPTKMKQHVQTNPHLTHFGESHPIIWILAVVVRLILIPTSKFPLMMLLWILFDLSCAVYCVSRVLPNQKRTKWLNIWKMLMIPSWILMYQILHGPGGTIHLLIEFYICVSILNIEYASPLQNRKDSFLCYCVIIIFVSLIRYYVGLISTECFFMNASSLFFVCWVCFAFLSRNEVLTHKIVEIENAKIEETTRRRILTVASHELRNPLQAMTFLLSHLDSFDFEPNKQEIIDDMKSSLSLTNSLIENVLDFGKITSEGVNLRHQPFSMLDLIERVGCIYFSQAESSSIDFFTFVDPEMPTKLLGDDLRITQIINNFVSNSLKFTRQGHVILISTVLKLLNNTRVSIMLSCEDTGIGVDPSDASRIFEPFQQARNSDTEHRGWGLGLSICRELVRIMGGTLEFESKLGGGTIVSIQLEFDIPTDGTLPIREKLIEIPHHFEIRHRNREYAICLEQYLIAMGALSVFVNVDLNQTSFCLHQSNICLLQDHNIGEDVDFSHYHSILILGEYMPDAMTPARTAQFFDRLKSIGEPIQLFRLNIRLVQLCQGMTGVFPSVEQIQKPQLKALKDARLLVVEDSHVINRLEKKILMSAGVGTIDCVFNGEEALRMVEMHDYDGILMDIQMPVMDGIETTKRIRNMSDVRKRFIPIIIVTGNSLFDYKECIMCGANQVMSKPVKTEDLISCVSMFCKN